MIVVTIRDCKQVSLGNYSLVLKSIKVLEEQSRFIPTLLLFIKNGLQIGDQIQINILI